MKVFYFLFIIYPLLASPIMLFAQIHEQTLHNNCTHIGPSTAQQIGKITSVLHQSIRPLESSNTTMSCLKINPPAIEEMTKWLENWSQQDEEKIPKSKTSRQEDNTSEPFLKNDKPKLVKLFRELTKNMNEPIQTECKNVTCVSQQIFGEKEGVQLLYMLARYGFNGSPFPFPLNNGRELWDSEGLDNVLTALSHFPENIFPIFYNKPLLRFKKGYIRPGQNDKYAGTPRCVAANSFIEVFDCLYTSSGGKNFFIQTIVHEIAHVISSEAELDRSTTWFDLSGWEETRTYQDDKVHVSYELKSPECIVSEYAKTSPMEDFADSAVHYRYFPKSLKEKCPGKYYYLKDFVFDGNEYLQEQVCDQNFQPLTR